MSSSKRPTRNVPKADSYLFLSSLSCVRVIRYDDQSVGRRLPSGLKGGARHLAQLPEVLRDARGARRQPFARRRLP